MSLVTRDPATGLRRGPVRFPDGNPPPPNGCRWCGIEQRHHGRQQIASAGLHAWERPTNTQLLARMKARRKNRATARRSCTTCEHYLPFTPIEEPCNPDGCGCTGYPAACDVRAAPVGAAFPITNCSQWEPARTAAAGDTHDHPNP